MHELVHLNLSKGSADTVDSDFLRGFYFREKFREKNLRNGEFTLSFTDLGK